MQEALTQFSKEGGSGSKPGEKLEILHHAGYSGGGRINDIAHKCATPLLFYNIPTFIAKKIKNATQG